MIEAAQTIERSDMRPEVIRVCRFAPLPPEDQCSREYIENLGEAIAALPRPVTIEEADGLVEVFATPDESTYFGLMLTLRNAIESAQQLPASIWHRRGPWVDEMRKLALESGLRPPPHGPP